MDSIQKRRSIRKYEDRQIEKSDIEEIIILFTAAVRRRNYWTKWKMVSYGKSV